MPALCPCMGPCPSMTRYVSLPNLIPVGCALLAQVRCSHAGAQSPFRSPRGARPPSPTAVQPYSAPSRRHVASAICLGVRICPPPCLTQLLQPARAVRIWTIPVVCATEEDGQRLSVGRLVGNALLLSCPRVRPSVTHTFRVLTRLSHGGRGHVKPLKPRLVSHPHKPAEALNRTCTRPSRSAAMRRVCKSRSASYTSMYRTRM